MRRSLSLLLLSLLWAGTTLAQEPNPGNSRPEPIRTSPENTRPGSIRKSPESTSRKRRSPRTDHGPVGVNISLWKNLSTQRTDTVGSTCFNLGVFSSMNRLDGLGVNLLAGVTGRDVNGIQVAGLSNLVGGSMRGVQVAGITNVNGNDLTGLSVSGLVGITGNHARGVILSGLANISGDHTRGISVGGLLNLSGESASGIHLAGITHVSGGKFKGFSGGGLLNVIGKELEGMQVSALANITAGEVTGIQLSGLGNVAGGTVRGVQLSAANMALRAKGLQIGLFNYYKERLDGFQLGLVNANPQTKVQLMVFGGNATKLNVGARFKNRLFYTILGGGTHYLDFGDKFSAALFYRAGLELPLYKQLFISGDLGYQHIETFKNKEYGIPPRLYALQSRINLEYHLTNHLGLFLTGGYGGSRHYTQGVTYDKGVLVEGGVVIYEF